MKLRRQQKYHSLKRPRIRQTWNKYNLYNMAHILRHNVSPQTDSFFQQKWKAKAMTRAYHGEHVSEHRWARIFDRKMQSVVPMSPKYLAEQDGSIEAKGRGSGLQMRTAHELGQIRREQLESRVDHLTGYEGAGPKYTPYMAMTFAPLERRLDTAIFRAMFASSARQARNFVIHGHVKVNGIKVDKPSYHLNPGDMFQVDPEMVLYATGVQRGQGIPPPPKDFYFPERSLLSPRRPPPQAPAPSRPSAYKPGDKPPDFAANAALPTGRHAERAALEASGGFVDEEGKPKPVEELTPEEQTKLQQKRLKGLIAGAKSLLTIQKSEMNATTKRRIRGWRELAQSALSKSQRDAARGKLSDAEIIDELSAFMGNLSVEDIKAGKTSTAPALASGENPNAEAAEAEAEAEEDDDVPTNFTSAQRTQLNEMLAEADIEDPASDPDSPSASPEASSPSAQPEKQEQSDMAAMEAAAAELDPTALLKPSSPPQAAAGADKPEFLEITKTGSRRSKPYQTPWAPRPWMSAFAMIPRYLEVNPNICSAVYLRHPVARPGRAEVPTPFPEFMNGLAFNYYLRRR